MAIWTQIYHLLGTKIEPAYVASTVHRPQISDGNLEYNDKSVYYDSKARYMGTAAITYKQKWREVLTPLVSAVRHCIYF